MKKIFGIVGWSGCGKTDLICRVIKYLKKQNFCVSSIKHSHHKFDIDKPGKDSFNHLSSGSNEVLIYNEKKWAMISSTQTAKISLNEVLKKFSNKTDLILVEGLKYSKIPKIEVVKSSQKRPLIMKNDSFIKAIVYDKKDEKLSNITLPTFKFTETEKISKFITNFKYE